MLDLSTLAARATATRAALTEAHAASAAKRNAASALRTGIDALTSDVLPALENAKRALEPSGVRLDIEPLWASDRQGKRAAVAIHARTCGAWPEVLLTLRSDLIEVQYQPSGLRVVRKPIHDPEVIGEVLPSDDDDVAATAVAFAVDQLLARAERGPTMQGSEVRGAGR